MTDVEKLGRIWDLFLAYREQHDPGHEGLYHLELWGDRSGSLVLIDLDDKEETILEWENMQEGICELAKVVGSGR